MLAAQNWEFRIMKTFPEELVLPQRTLTGAGRIAELLPNAAEYGVRGVLVHGKSLANSGKRDEILRHAPDQVDVVCFEHQGGEPTIHDVEEVRRAARSHDAAWIAAAGGGSVIDLAKAAAGLCHSELTVEQHHQGAPLDRPGVPFLAAPSTAGTGSEATIVSVLIDPERNLKKSVRHHSYMPRLVVLDPELLASCPPRIIAHSGMDALVQAVESYASRNATWLSRQLSARAISLIASSLVDVYHNPSCDRSQDLLFGSYLAGLALSMARLGVIHGLVHPLGVRYDLPHGWLCGITLPASLRLNRKAMGEMYEEMSALAGGDLQERTEALLRELGIEESPLAGKEIVDEAGVIRETLASGSTQANPKPVTEEDVKRLLCELFSRRV